MPPRTKPAPAASAGAGGESGSGAGRRRRSECCARWRSKLKNDAAERRDMTRRSSDRCEQSATSARVRVKDGRLGDVLVLFYIANAHASDATLAAVEEAASRLEGNVVTLAIDCSSELNSGLCRDHGVAGHASEDDVTDIKLETVRYQGLAVTFIFAPSFALVATCVATLYSASFSLGACLHHPSWVL
ncbi:VHL domain-containing protein [Pycnococcus provasolii]